MSNAMASPWLTALFKSQRPTIASKSAEFLILGNFSMLSMKSKGLKQQLILIYTNVFTTFSKKYLNGPIIIIIVAAAAAIAIRLITTKM